MLRVGPGEVDLAPGAAWERDCGQGRGSKAGFHSPSPVAFREDLRLDLSPVLTPVESRGWPSTS